MDLYLQRDKLPKRSRSHATARSHAEVDFRAALDGPDTGDGDGRAATEGSERPEAFLRLPDPAVIRQQVAFLGSLAQRR